MKFSMSAGSMRTFTKCLLCMGKIGDDLHLEPTSRHLLLKTVNSSRSAFVGFFLYPRFFIEFETGVNPQDYKCKIPMKSAAIIIKAGHALDRKLEKVELDFASDQDRLVVRFFAQDGAMQKKYRFIIFEADPLHAIYSTDQCRNSISVSSKLLLDSTSSFMQKLDEVTWITAGDKLTMRNYADPEADDARQARTEVILDAAEFDHFKIGAMDEVTFCYKEFKAILQFVESIGESLEAFFDLAGRPIVFQLDLTDSGLKAEFVLATIGDISSMPGSQSESQLRSEAQQPQASQNFAEDRAGPSTIPDEQPVEENMETVEPANQDPDSDVLPGTPPSKRFKSVLLAGLSQYSLYERGEVPTQRSTVVRKVPKRILCPASDSEEDDDM